MPDFQIVQPGGHLDQLLRQTRAHLAQLSQLGDLKASMLLTTSAIVVPLVLRFTDDPVLRVPALLMIGASLLTILLAAYAVMPKLGGRRTPPDAPGFNLLFFADFVTLPYDEYLRRLEAVLNDPSRTYEAQVREVYLQGVYLARRKYRFIRLAYLSFMAGVLASALAAALLYFLTR